MLRAAPGLIAVIVAGLVIAGLGWLVGAVQILF